MSTRNRDMVKDQFTILETSDFLMQPKGRRPFKLLVQPVCQEIGVCLYN